MHWFNSFRRFVSLRFPIINFAQSKNDAKLNSLWIDHWNFKSNFVTNCQSWKYNLNLGNEHYPLFIHYPDSLFNTWASGLGPGYIYVGQSYSSVGHQYTCVGQAINLNFTWVGQNVRRFPPYVGQFHEWVGQCPWPTNILTLALPVLVKSKTRNDIFLINWSTHRTWH